MVIPEVYVLAQKIFSKIDPKELDLSKKEVTEFLTERRRLTQYYKESLKEILPSLKQYMELKRKIIAQGRYHHRRDSPEKARRPLRPPAEDQFYARRNHAIF
jgi:hypothetical protein